MAMDPEYAEWLENGGRIRVSARAIALNPAGDRLLVERVPERNSFYNFIGGGVEEGETLEETLRRELGEETDLVEYELSYLFFAERFLTINGRRLHGLEHFFLLTTPQEQVTPRLPDVEFAWLPLAQLAKYDLRPHVVRDAVLEGSYTQLKHLVIRSS